MFEIDDEDELIPRIALKTAKGRVFKTIESRSVGAPSGYDPAFCEAIVAFMARNHSMSAFAALIGRTPRTLRLWQSKFPEFAEAVEIGRAGRVAYFENVMNRNDLTAAEARQAWKQVTSVAPDEYPKR